MDIKPKKGTRKGQTLFNFLEWLYRIKGYKATPRKVADTFTLPNEELDELWKEYKKNNNY